MFVVDYSSRAGAQLSPRTTRAGADTCVLRASAASLLWIITWICSPPTRRIGPGWRRGLEGHCRPGPGPILFRPTGSTHGGKGGLLHRCGRRPSLRRESPRQERGWAPPHLDGVAFRRSRRRGACAHICRWHGCRQACRRDTASLWEDGRSERIEAAPRHPTASLACPLH